MLPESAIDSSAEPRPILVVDDDPVTARLISGALEARRLGPTSIVRTLAEAGHAIATHRFAAAITDLHLPDGNGMEFVHLARRGRHSQNRALTIIVCSAYAAGRTSTLLRRLGADEVLAKPPDIGRLASRLSRA